MNFLKTYKVLISCAILSIAFLDVVSQNNYDEFLLNNKIYRPGSPFFTAGYGIGFQVSSKNLEQSLGLGINFRIKDYYVNLGYHFSSDKPIYDRSLQKITDLHIGIGVRNETLKSNVYYFGGISNCYGYYYNHTDTLGQKWYTGFNSIGVYSEIQFTHKIFYDIGTGISAYACINKYYRVIGVQLHVYFSTSFRKKIDFIEMK